MKRTFLFLVLALQLTTLKGYSDSVVGIHGFLTDWRSMKPIQCTLEKCDLDVYLWNYTSRRRCIEEHACNLIPLLQEIACCNPGRPIHFVTHSTGALVLRAALNIPECPQEAKIGCAVLLAPPNQGSSLAQRFAGFTPIDFVMGDRSGSQLQNYNGCDISARFGDFPPCMDVLVIAGTKGNQIWFCEPNDGFLTVDETSLNTPYSLKCVYVNHGDIMKCSEVRCCMKTFIMNYYCQPEPTCVDSDCSNTASSICPREADVCHPEAGESSHSSER